MKKLLIVVAFGGMLAGCNQQAVADLATCKSDLTKAQTELTAVQAAADQKVAALDAELKQAQDQLATYQSAADAAAAAAAKRAGKVAVTKKAHPADHRPGRQGQGEALAATAKKGTSMTKRFLVLVAFLAACGTTSDTVYTISTGSYAVAAGTATAAFPADNCNIVPLFATGEPPIDVTVSGTTANFDLKGGQVLPQYKTTATITDNEIAHVTDANFETAVGATCVFTTRVKVNGEITANDSMHLVARYDIAVKGGTTCTLADVDAKTLPCTSEVDFLAEK
jgi:hypothetical protein